MDAVPILGDFSALDGDVMIMTGGACKDPIRVLGASLGFWGAGGFGAEEVENSSGQLEQTGDSQHFGKYQRLL